MKEERPPDQESTRFTHKTRYEPVTVSSNRESIKNKNWNHWGGPPVFFPSLPDVRFIYFRCYTVYTLIVLFHCTYWNDGRDCRGPVWSAEAISSEIVRRRKQKIDAVAGFACPPLPDDTYKK